MLNRFNTRRCWYALVTIALAIAGSSLTQRELAREGGDLATAEVNRSSANASPVVTRATLQNVKMRGSKGDACSLLQSSDIQRVQGERFKDAKATERLEGGLRSSQCFYSLATLSKSIVLTIMVKDSGGTGRDPRDFWNETFHRETERRSAERESEQEGETEAAAEPIRGIGDEAFWTGNRIGSALYVLKGSTLIRLSLGGSDNEETRIRKSKALAQRVIRHLG